MVEKERKVTGKVTEVRIIDENDVIVFVRAASPENIQNRIVRFHINIHNDIINIYEKTNWTELAVGDMVQITIIDNPYHNDYKLAYVDSDVVDADNL